MPKLQGQPQCSKGANPYGGDPQVGDPVSVCTANLYEQAVDFRTLGKNPLEFIRSYNSQARTAGVLGTSWQTNWERNLTLGSNCPGTSTPCQIVALRADGQQLTFNYNTGSSAYTTDADVTLTLTISGSNYLLTDIGGTVETYNSTGQLQSVAFMDGYAQTLHYNGSNQLTSVSDNQSRALTFTYNAGGNLATMADPNGETFTYDYATAFPTYSMATNKLAAVIEPGSLSPMVTYVYGNSNFPTYLTGVIDELDDGFASWTYDTLGEATSSSLAGGAGLTTMTYNGNGTNTATFPLGEQVTYAFSTVQGAPKISSQARAASGGIPAATITYAYDSNGFLGTMTDYNGNETVYVNNSRGLPTSITEATGTPQARTTTYTWLSNLALPSEIQTPRETVTYSYDSTYYDLLGRTEIDNGTGNTLHMTYTYDTLGHRLTANGPRTDVSQITTYTYTANGYLNTVKDPLGHITTITSTNGRGQPLAITDPNGAVTSLAYDALGRLTTLTVDATGTPASTVFTYNAAGEITKLTQPDGTYLNYAYDNAHRLTTITDAFDDAIVYTLDAMGNITQQQVTNPSGTLVKTQSRVYDIIGRLSEVIGASSQITTYSYDSDSNNIAIKDALGNTTTQVFDALNRLIAITDPLTHTTTYAYDSQDNRTTITDPRSLTTSYSYNGFRQITSETSPDSGTTTYTLDAAGNRLSQKDARGIVTSYTYDALNRVKTQTYPASTGENITYTYDATAGGNKGIGHLTGYSDESGITTLVYDARGNVTSDSRTIGGKTYTTGYAYNLADRITTITYPSGRTVNYGYNSVGRIDEVTTTLSGSTLNIAGYVYWEPFGPVSNLGYGTGLITTYAYDKDYRMTTITTAGDGLNVQNLALAYNGVDNILSITDGLDSTRTQTFTYDKDYRLLTADGKYGYLTYTYDANGNRLTSTLGGTTTTYTYPSTSNRLSSAGTETFSYTANGNEAYDSSGTTTYTYENRNRYKTLTEASTLTATYMYNALGERVSKQTGGATTQYEYDEQRHLIAESNGSTGAVIREYVYLNDQPIAQIEASSGQVYFIHSDQLGTPQKITNESPTIVWDRIQQPFGSTYSITGSYASNLRFPGQYYDNESGLNYNLMRDYNPNLSRYIETDPIGMSGTATASMNLYSYASQNPVSSIDPTGEQALRLPLQFCRLFPEACIAGPLLIYHAVVPPAPAEPADPAPATPANPQQCVPEKNDHCLEQWLDDSEWCLQFRGRTNIACQSWAKEELFRCRDGEPRQPFRL